MTSWDLPWGAKEDASEYDNTEECQKQTIERDAKFCVDFAEEGWGRQPAVSGKCIVHTAACGHNGGGRKDKANERKPRSIHEH